MSRPFRHAAAALALFIAIPAYAAEKPAAPKVDPAHEAAMAEMMKYASPGPAHEALKSSAGTWDCTVKSWGAPGEPTVSKGTSVNTLILGGRYLEQRFTSTMFGQPFEGYGLTGYDNRKGVYTNFWIDNSSTEMLTGDGSYDAKTGTWTSTMTSTGPDGKPMVMKNVTKVVNPDKHVFSMYAPMEGKETLMMEITYDRKK